MGYSPSGGRNCPLIGNRFLLVVVVAVMFVVWASAAGSSVVPFVPEAGVGSTVRCRFLLAAFSSSSSSS
jgi:hypothetical protein